MWAAGESQNWKAGLNQSLNGANFLIWTDLCVCLWFCLFADGSADAAAEEPASPFDESQTEFRSILSFGVKEPWVSKGTFLLSQVCQREIEVVYSYLLFTYCSGPKVHNMFIRVCYIKGNANLNNITK